MVMKFEKKDNPVVEGIQWTGFNDVEISDFVTVNFTITRGRKGKQPFLSVSSFVFDASLAVGDWLLRGDGFLCSITGDELIRDYKNVGARENFTRLFKTCLKNPNTLSESKSSDDGEELKLFVWDEYNTDHSCGLAVVVAHNLKQAQELLAGEGSLEYVGPVREYEITPSMCFTCDGGG